MIGQVTEWNPNTKKAKRTSRTKMERVNKDLKALENEKNWLRREIGGDKWLLR